MSQVYNPTQSLVDNYDMESPVNAMSAYARTMHEHTKRQLNIASKNADRRSSLSSSSPTSLTSASSLDSDAAESPV